MKFRVYGLIAVLLAASSAFALRAALTGTDVQPASLTVGATGAVPISFMNSNPIPGDGTIEVTFPAGFDVTTASSASSGTMDGGFIVSFAGQVVTITRSGGGFAAPSPHNIVLQDVRNPITPGLSGTYAIRTTDSLGATIDDDPAVPGDTFTTSAGITVTPENGLVTTEAGGTDTFTVVLNTQPTANVTIGISSSDTSEGTVSPASLVFTDLDWDTPQVVTITGVDDAVVDGSVLYYAITAAAVSSDADYNGLDASNVSVMNGDDDAAVPTQLAFVQQPSNTVAGAPMWPPAGIAAQDASGNLVISYTGTITVAIETNPGGGILSGTLAVPASNGLAIFPDLSIDAPGNGYTLAATAAGLAGASSSTFNVVAGGGVSMNAGSSQSPSLAMDASGNPKVAWADDTSGNAEILLRRWNGSAWVGFGGSGSDGGISANAGSSNSPSLAQGEFGNIVVAWYDNTNGNNEIYVRRWDGTVWVGIGGSGTGGGVSANAGSSEFPACALDGAGNPVVAWHDDTSGNHEIYAMGWNGAAWVEYGGSATGGGISANVGISVYPSLALNASNNPVVAWHDDTSGNYEIYVKRWNGSAWVEYGGSASAGGISGAVGSNFGASLVLDASGNPVVAWRSVNGASAEIYVKRWNGAAWVEYGGSATGGGISANPGYSESPRLALDASGDPVVAWDDDTSGNNEIYVKRWDGASWVDYAGSGSGGGVSANVGTSWFPSLALDASGNPAVAWEDNTTGNIEIHLTRWDGTTWRGYQESSGLFRVSTGALANGIQATPYSAQLHAVDGPTPYAWTVVGGALPAGLNLDASGLISGTPSATGVFNFTVEAMDNASGIASKDLSIAIDASVGTLTSTDVQPDTLAIGATATSIISFISVNPIPADGKIAVTFPGEFDVSGASFAAAGSMDGGFVVSFAGQVVTIARDGIGTPAAPGAHTLALEFVRNPVAAGVTGTYIIQTMDVSDAVIDQDLAVAGDAFTMGALTATDVEPSTLTAGAFTPVTIGFTSADSLSITGRITVTFPAGYDVSGAINPFSAGIDGTLSVFFTGQTVIIVRNADGTVTAPGAYTLALQGIRNPTSAGTTGDYAIQLAHSDGVVFAEDLAVPGDTFSVSVLTSTDVEPVSLTLGATGAVTVEFVSADEIPFDGKIAVTFPAEYDVSGAANPFCASLDGALSIGIFGQTVLIARDGAGSTASSGFYSLSFDGVRNPANAGTTGDYAIQLTHFDNYVFAEDLAVPGDDFSVSALTTTNVEPNSFAFGATVEVSIAFTSVDPIPLDGKIVVTFPAEYNVSGANTPAAATIDGGFALIVAGQVVTIARNGAGTAAAAGAHTLTLQGIQNPASSGVTGNYAIQLTHADDVVFANDLAIPGDAFDMGGLSATDVQPASATIGDTSETTITFTTTGAIPLDGKIVVAFPAEYDISGANTPYSPTIDGGFTLIVAGQVVTFARDGLGTAAAVGAHILTVQGVRNPASAGATGFYGIQLATSGDVVFAEDLGIPGDVFNMDALTATDVTPTALTLGSTGDVVVQFTTPDSIPLDGKIVVIFPAEYDVSGAINPLCASLDGGLFVTVAGQVVTVLRDGAGSTAPSGPYTLSIDGIRNSISVGLTGNYGIQLAHVDDVVFAEDLAIPGETFSVSTLSATDVAPADLSAGATGQVTVSFTTPDDIPADGKIVVTFPAGFDISSASSPAAGTLDGAFYAVATGSVLTIARDGLGSTGAAGAHSLTVQDIKNPVASGVTGSYAIQLAYIDDFVFAQDLTVPEDTITPDVTAPVAGIVEDGLSADIDVQTSATEISANWSGFDDPETGIVGYEWAIGTEPGGVDIQGFVSVGLDASANNNSLSLADAATYYVTVRAMNGSGQTVGAFSDGVLVDASAPETYLISAPVLYVPSDVSNLYSAIDPSSGVTLATLPMNNPRQVALDPDGIHAWVTNYDSNIVAVVDVWSHSIIATISVPGPSGIVILDNPHRAYVVCEGDGSVAVIDASTRRLLDTVAVGIGPRGIGALPGGSKVYVANSGDNTVSVIGTASDTVINTIAVGIYPMGVAVAPDGSRVYVSNRNITPGAGTVSVITSATDTVLTTFATGSGTEEMAVSANGSVLYVCNANFYGGGGDVRAFNTASFGIIGAPAAINMPRGIALRGAFVYVSDATFVHELDSGTLALQASFPTDANALKLAVGIPRNVPSAVPPASSNSSVAVFAFQASEAGGTFERSLDAGPWEPVASPEVIAVTEGYHTYAVRAIDQVSTPDPTPITFEWTADFTPPETYLTATPWIYVPSYSGQYSAVDPNTGSILGTLAMNSPVQVALDPDGIHAWITNPGNDSVSVVDTWANSAISVIGVPDTPYGVTVAAGLYRAYVSCETAGVVAAIDANSYVVLDTVTVGTAPRGIGALPDATKVYVANTGDNTVSVIDAASNTVVATIPVGTFPVGIVVAPDGSRVYVSNRNTGSVEGSISVIDTSTDTVLTTFAAGSGPEAMALSPFGERLYVCNTDFSGGTGSIQAFETSGFTLQDTAAAVNPQGIAVVFDRLYVSDGNAVKIFFSATLTLDTSLGVAAAPRWLAMGQPQSFFPGTPTAYTMSASADFGFFSTEPLADTFEASIDGGAFQPVLSPNTLVGLPGGWHSFDIRAIDSAGNPDPASVTFSWFVDPVAPTAPGQPFPDLNPNDGFFTLSWGAASDAESGVKDYEIQASNNGGASWYFIGRTVNTYHTISNLVGGTYLYQVRALDYAGNTSPWSAQSDSVVVDTTPPGTPGAPTVDVNPNAGSFTLSWSAVTDTGGSGLYGYEVQRSTNGVDFTTVVSGVAGTSLAESVIDGIYVYRVIGLDNAGNHSVVSPLSVEIVAGTVNTKGWLKTAYSGGNSSYYRWAATASPGTVGARWTKSIGGSTQVKTGDVNGDGYLEVVTLTQTGAATGTLNVYDREGTVLSSWSTYWGTLTLADVDSDNVPEIAIAYRDATDNLDADFHSGDGTFLKTVTRGASGADSGWALEGAQGDYLAFSCDALSTLYPRGLSVCSYSSGTEFDNYFVGPSLWGLMAVVDFEGDGIMDFVLPSGTPGDGASGNGTTDDELWAIALNAGDGLLETFKTNSFGGITGLQGSLSPIAADLEDSGRVTTILYFEGHYAGSFPGTNHVYIMKPDGFLDDTVVGPDNGGSWYAAIGYYNQPDMDVFVSTETDETIYIYDHSATPVAQSAADAGRVLAVNDFDADGNDDVIVFQSSTGSIRALQNDLATEIFAYPTAGFSDLNSFAVSDLDNDGTNEIIYSDGATLHVIGGVTAPSAPSALAQYQQDGSTPISVGASTPSATIVLKGTVSDPDLGNTVSLEVEVQPVGTAFTGAATATSAFVTSGTTVGTAVGPLGNASFHWQARTVDNNGQASSWTSFGGNADPNDVDFAVDATFPDTTITGTPNALSNSSTATFTFNATESGCTFEGSLDGGSFATVTSPATLISLSDGAHTFQVRAIDTAANTDPTPASYSWTVDATIPTQPGTPTASVNPNAGDYTLTWTASTDGGSGLAGYQVQRSSDGGSNWNNVTIVATASYAVAGQAQGSYLYRIQAVDQAGNLSTVSGTSSAVVVDTTAPGAPGTPTPTSLVNTGTFNISWTASTDAGGSAVALYTVDWSLNGGAFGTLTTTASTSLAQSGLAAGSYSYRVRATDGAGNVGSATTSPTIIVDITQPVAGTVLDGPGADIDVQTSASNMSANWSGFSDPESGIAGYEWAIGTASGSADVQAFTSVGLVSNATNGGLSLSNGTAYFVTVRATNAAGLSLSASSDGVQVSINQPASSPAGMAQLQSDQTPIALGGTSATAGVILRATVSDPESNTVRLQVEVQPSGSSFSGTPTASSDLVASGSTVSIPLELANNSYIWKARAMDASGAASSWVQFGSGTAFVVNFSPNSPPPAPAGASLEQLKNNLSTILVGDSTGETLVKIRGTVTDPNGDMVRLEVAWRPTSVSFTGVPTHQSTMLASGSTAVVTVSSLANGTYHWRARMVDSSGAGSAWTSFGGNADGATDVQVDVTINPPNTPSGLTATNVGNTGDIALEATLTDPGDTVKMQVEVKPAAGTFTGIPDSESPFVASGSTGRVKLIGLQNGEYKWRARAVDAKGNASSWTDGSNFNIAVNFAPDAPVSLDVLKLDGTDAGAATNENVLLFVATVTDANGDLVQIEVTIAGDASSNATSDFVASGTQAMALVQLPQGSYTWQARARDSRSLTSATASGPAITINNQPPVIVSTSASPATGNAPLDVTLNAVVTSDDAIARYTWDFDGDGTNDFESSSSAAVSNVYSLPGTYTAVLTVADVAGNTATTNRTITVTEPPPPPSSLAADVFSGPAPLTVNFTADVPNLDAVVSFEWDFNGDTVADAITAGPSTTTLYTTPGTYAAALRIIYDDAWTDLLTVTPSIQVGVPAAGLSSVRIIRIFTDANNNGQRDEDEALVAINTTDGLAGTTITVQEGQRVGFEGAATLPADTIEVHAWEWDFTGDGTIDAGSGTSNTATFGYDVAGTYDVTLHIIDRVVGATEPRAQASTSMNVVVAPSTAKNLRVWFVKLRSGKTISGNSFVFNVNATPASELDFSTVKVQAATAEGGPYTDVPATAAHQEGSPSALLTVNLTALIANETLTAGTPYYWRCQITTAGATPTVVNSTDDGQQGALVLTPLVSGGQIETNTASPPSNTTELDPDAQNTVELGGETQVSIPFEGVPDPATPEDALQVLMRSLMENPTNTNDGVSEETECMVVFVSEFREVKVTDGTNEFSLTKPARVRIYYPDADNDGIIDGSSLPEQDLIIFRFVRTRWVELEDTVRNFSENWIEGTTPGFSYFTTGAQPGGFISGSGSGGTSSPGGRCIGSSGAAGGGVAGLAALLALGLAALLRRCKKSKSLISYILCLSAVLCSEARAQEPQKEVLEQEKRQSMEPPSLRDSLGEDFAYEYGGWFRPAYYSFKRGDKKMIGWADQDLRLWIDMGYQQAHRLYARVRDEVLYYSNDDEPEGGNEIRGVKPRMDLLFYDIGDSNIKFRFGRQYLSLGAGFVYNQIGEGVSIESHQAPVTLTGFATRAVPSQDDIDRSRPDFDNTDRRFVGGQATLDLVDNHKQYLLAMVQRDENDDDLDTQKFDFDSEYWGAGSTGQVVPSLLYTVETVFETGRRYAHASVESPKGIHAMALLARGTLYLGEDDAWSLRGEYIFGSGDDNRAHAVNTIQGNQPGTDDGAFLGFGYLFTGLALAPRPVNLHIIHAGATGSFLRDRLDTGPVEAGIDIFAYRKHHETGGIDDVYASPFNGIISRDIGEEYDIFANWKILSDLGATLRLGVFNPGHAYPEDAPLRTFFGAGVVYSF